MDKTACGLVCEMKSCLCMLNYWLSNTSACAHSIRVIVVMNATIEIITWEYCLVVHFVNWERSCMLDWSECQSQRFIKCMCVHLYWFIENNSSHGRRSNVFISRSLAPFFFTLLRSFLLLTCALQSCSFFINGSISDMHHHMNNYHKV